MKRTSTSSLWPSLLVLPLLLATGCQSAARADLAANDVIYQDLEYATKLPGDRTVFVAPLADARQAPVDASARPGEFPVVYDGDARWERPIVAMVDEVLGRELAQSGLFAQVLDQPAQADVVVLPSLVTFATAAIEEVAGGRSLAEVGVRVQVYGPVAGDGQRPLLLEQVFGDREVTDVGFMTASRYVLAGAATRATMLRLLQTLDSKNVGRNGMPMPAPTLLPNTAVPTAPSK